MVYRWAELRIAMFANDFLEYIFWTRWRSKVVVDRIALRERLILGFASWVQLERS